jgi:hypothetical protein
MEQKTRMTIEEVPLDKLEKAGVDRSFISKMEPKELSDFLNGFRSEKLYTVNARINDEEHRIPAKLRLQKEEDGSVSVKVHPIQRLSIPDEYMGHTFTKEQKAALLNDKNLGQTVELTSKKGVKDTYYLSVDPKTNELVPLRTKQIQAPDKIKGVTLSSEQKEKLAAGHKVTVNGMTGKNEKVFSATLQVDAATRKIGFSDFKSDIFETAKQVNKEEKKSGVRQKVS